VTTSYRTFWVVGLSLALCLGARNPAFAGTRLKDISTMSTEYSVPLVGYGLVVGLDGTGDGKNTQFTVRSLANMLQHMGVTVNAEDVKVKNVAAVMVTAGIDPLQHPGGRLDVTVSSLGDAKSLQGGVLLLTPLSGPDGVNYVMAQGPLTIGGFNIQTGGGNAIQNNYTLVGRIPGGGLVQEAPPDLPEQSGSVSFVLQDPDITTATRVAEAINTHFGEVATAVDAATITVTVPEEKAYVMPFLARLEAVEVDPDIQAKVVLNERTGTIVAGGQVTVAPVALAHGALTVQVSSSPVISQPLPFSNGETAYRDQTDIAVQEEAAKVVAFEEVASVAEVAAALNAIGATPRDIIAIIQAIQQAGALRAELIIM
jgi:flagellar P-ring protein precursor FlgI